MRIGFICNSSLGIPSFMNLLKTGRLAGMAVSNRLDETLEYLKFNAQVNRIFCLELAQQSLAESLKAWLDTVKPDVVLVHTFPWKIPAEVLDIPRLGFYNFHYALLPEYRGSDGIFWELKNRAPFGGVSIHKMDAAFDKGPIALIEKVEIHPEETYGMHVAKLAYAGEQANEKFLKLLEEHQEAIPLQPQDESIAKYYPRPNVPDVTISWEHQTQEEIIALVKACNPWNKGAYTNLAGNWPVRIVEVTPAATEETQHMEPGTIFMLNHEQGMIVRCKDGKLLRIDILYVEEGFLPGSQLIRFGVKEGEKFVDASPQDQLQNLNMA